MQTMFQSPVLENARISQVFGLRPAVYKRFGLAGHNGFDYAAPLGTDVLAIGSGRVMDVGDEGKDGYGKFIKIQHEGFQSTYGHLQAQLMKIGDTVERGAHIGELGNTGFSTGQHCHLTLKKTDDTGKVLNKANGYLGAINPADFLFEVWECEAQEYAVKAGITTGDNPRGNVTRAQVWKMFERFNGKS